TPEAKARLLPALSPSNVDKTRAAPVTAIIGYDTRFYELLPKLFPHRPEMKNPYEANATLAETVAFRNGTLQGAYFMIAARAVGIFHPELVLVGVAAVDAHFLDDRQPGALDPGQLRHHRLDRVHLDAHVIDRTRTDLAARRKGEVHGCPFR